MFLPSLCFFIEAHWLVLYNAEMDENGLLNLAKIVINLGHLQPKIANYRIIMARIGCFLGNAPCSIVSVVKFFSDYQHVLRLVDCIDCFFIEDHLAPLLS